MEEVILVDSRDNPLGTMEKMEAHKQGVLHRAFSVLLFNSRGELMIQKRAEDKYHSGGLWTNTCCSHPRPEELISDAVKRRLLEEMGINAEVEFLYKFIYRYQFTGELIEHELDYVFIGITDDEPIINREEVAEWKWSALIELQKKISENPEKFTFWFLQIIERITSQPSVLPAKLKAIVSL